MCNSQTIDWPHIIALEEATAFRYQCLVLVDFRSLNFHDTHPVASVPLVSMSDWGAR